MWGLKMKRISYMQLKNKLIELDYNKAEIRSTVWQIRRFDRDLKLLVYYWLNMNMLPGNEDPSFVIGGKYSVRRLCDEFGMKPPAAFIVLQTYRKNPQKAEEMIFYSSSRAAPDMSRNELDYLYKKFGITDDESNVPGEENDVIIEDKENKGDA